MDQFPSNSKRLDRSQEEPKKVERVVQGEVVRRKTPRGRRMMQNLLIGGDAQSVWGYVSTDILAPAFRDLIEDAFVGFITRMVRGDDYRPTRGRSRGGLSSRTDYQAPFRGSHRREDPRRELSRRARSTHDLDEIILENRVDAEEVLDRMAAWLDRYEVVSLAEYYELCGLSGAYTDRRYGWRDIRDIQDASIHRARGGGFVIRLPPPEVLD